MKGKRSSSLLITTLCVVRMGIPLYIGVYVKLRVSGTVFRPPRVKRTLVSMLLLAVTVTKFTGATELT